MAKNSQSTQYRVSYVIIKTQSKQHTNREKLT